MLRRVVLRSTRKAMFRLRVQVVWYVHAQAVEERNQDERHGRDDRGHCQHSREEIDPAVNQE